MSRPTLIPAPWTLAVLFAALAARPAAAAFTWPGCGEVQEKEFRYQPIVGRGSLLAPKVVDATLSEPIHMALDLRPDNTTDIYWVERHGGLKRYIAARNQVVKLGALGIVTAAGDEQGLVGIALDPDFRVNRWLYLFYSPSAEDNVFRVSRFGLNADFTALVAASEKVILRIPSQRVSCCHTGGAMAFDLHKDLWIAVGKNSPDHPRSINEATRTGSAEGTAANGADLRGGILRIHPDNSAKGYSIPDGNYGVHWSAYFKSKGEAALAAEYADSAKVLPEIYVKGARNPYSIAVDPVRRWVAWGEFGPNLQATMTEEHNLVTKPAFGGYPYFAGGGGIGGSGCSYDRGICELWRTTENSAGTQQREAPVNDSRWNAGPKRLPPVEPALHTYPRSGAITGPIYRYDGGSPSPIKWPPHFENAWLVGDHRKQWIKIYKLSETGDRLADSLTWFAGYGFYDILDIQRGPDGAVYVLNYAGNRSASVQTHIGRIEYTGSCRPPEPRFPAVPATAAKALPSWAPDVRLVGPSLRIEGAGAYRLEVRDARGRVLGRAAGAGPREHSLVSLSAGGAGLCFVTVSGSWGTRTRTLMRF